MQLVVEKMLAAEGASRLGLGRAAFEARVWAWKAQYGGFITAQMRAMGASCDWSRERFTLDAQLSGARPLPGPRACNACMHASSRTRHPACMTCMHVRMHACTCPRSPASTGKLPLGYLRMLLGCCFCACSPQSHS